MRFFIHNEGTIKQTGHVLPSVPLSSFLEGLKPTLEKGDRICIEKMGLNVSLVNNTWVNTTHFVCNNGHFSTE